jgi:hypothetical protein
MSWIHDAACRDQPPDLFHPIGAGDTCPEAQRICQACPVIAECLQDALTQRDVLAARGKRDIAAEVLRLHAKRWHPKAIALALNVDNAIVYRIVKANREGQVVA